MKRYRLSVGPGYETYQDEHPEGEWVQFEDARQVEAKVETREAEISRLSKGAVELGRQIAELRQALDEADKVGVQYAREVRDLQAELAEVRTLAAEVVEDRKALRAELKRLGDTLPGDDTQTRLAAAEALLERAGPCTAEERAVLDAMAVARIERLNNGAVIATADTRDIAMAELARRAAKEKA
jgi:predicted RNase H-like nuclease (RuvC/YqgF family)